MGNIFSRGENENIWRFNAESVVNPTEPMRVKSYYQNGVRQRVIISGAPLNITLGIQNVTVEVSGDDHHISILGNGNTITLTSGSRVSFRIEGDVDGNGNPAEPRNKLILGESSGEENRVYGSGFDVTCGPHPITSNPIRDAQTGNLSDGCPETLAFSEQPLEAPAEWENPGLLRSSYIPRNIGGGGGGASGGTGTGAGNGTNNGNGNAVVASPSSSSGAAAAPGSISGGNGTGAQQQQDQNQDQDLNVSNNADADVNGNEEAAELDAVDGDGDGEEGEGTGEPQSKKAKIE